MTNEELAEIAQSGSDTDGSCLMELWNQNQGYIHAVLKNYDGLAELGDMEQEAFIGMMSAIPRWDSGKGVPFMVFCGNWIRSAVGRYVEKSQGIPINKQMTIRKLHKVEADFQQEHHRSPSDNEISDIMGLTENELEEIRKAGYAQNTASLDEEHGGDGDDPYTLEELTASTVEDPADFVVDRVQSEELSSVIWSEVDALDPDQSSAIRGRFQEEKQLSEIAMESGRTVAQVESDQRKGLTKLRTSPRSRKALLPFWSDDRIRSEALQGGSTGTFSRKWTSSTERVALKLAEREQ